MKKSPEDYLNRDLESQDMPEEDGRGVRNEDRIETSPELSPESTMRETDALESGAANPWDTPGNIKVFELGRPIDKNTLSYRASDAAPASESPNSFRKDQGLRSLGYKKPILGLLTVAVGGLIGSLIAVYLFR